MKESEASEEKRIPSSAGSGDSSVTKRFALKACEMISRGTTT